MSEERRGAGRGRRGRERERTSLSTSDEVLLFVLKSNVFQNRPALCCLSLPFSSLSLSSLSDFQQIFIEYCLISYCIELSKFYVTYYHSLKSLVYYKPKLIISVFMGRESGLSWSSAQGTLSRHQLGYVLIWKLSWGSISGCWQNLLPWSCVTEVPFQCHWPGAAFGSSRPPPALSSVAPHRHPHAMVITSSKPAKETVLLQFAKMESHTM